MEELDFLNIVAAIMVLWLDIMNIDIIGYHILPIVLYDENAKEWTMYETHWIEALRNIL